MTPEQKQRIEQIRERMGRYKLEPYAPDLWWDDTNFLLSLVKEQEAENGRVLKLYNAAWLWVQQQVKHPNSGLPPAALTLMEMLPLLPISMRSACVEKVKGFRDASYWSDVNRMALTKLIEELETLSIEQPKE